MGKRVKWFNKPTKFRVFKELCRIYPDNYIVLDEHLSKHSTTKEHKVIFKAYIDSPILGDMSWSPDFDTIGDLHTYIADKVGDAYCSVSR